MEKQIPTNGKYFDMNCKQCASLLRFERESEGPEPTEDDTVVVICRFLNKDCEYVGIVKQTEEKQSGR